MPARPKSKPDYPKTITFENGRVRVSRRGNGKFALSWRENGGTQRTTITEEDKALDFARKKARLLNAGTMAEWITPADRDLLLSLRKLAGTEDGAARRLLEDVQGAKGWLEGGADLTAAARWYAEHGPLKVHKATLEATVAKFLLEYSGMNLATFRKDLSALMKAFPDAMMTDLTADDLQTWCYRKVKNRTEDYHSTELVPASIKTIRNRCTNLVTFFNRAQDWKLILPGEHAAAVVKKRLPDPEDKGKVIFSVEQGRELLRIVRRHAPDLETYLLLAGWLGLRPTECRRLTWNLIDFKRGYVHITVKVGGKNSAERYVPMAPAVTKRLAELKRAKVTPAKNNHVCLHNSDRELCDLAREHGFLKRWPIDVLRHSFCSYRLAVTHDIAKVAHEAGNSPKIIQRYYRKPVLPEEGEAWWKLIEEAA